ncbi:murein transglycosylase A [Janthinobacterium sp. B9-8]|uniref:murein transglycosylase A n=1 Tax=Janthinobacterium sp. B9-8 TaxID=1236179 RepID=UPI00061CEBF7|nr:MltA domain-containing protein [Janthinobacterium sp. B9-8]AMC34203.1 transglycosylase [Janthinobacterium sp. B9-8]
MIDIRSSRSLSLAALAAGLFTACATPPSPPSLPKQTASQPAHAVYQSSTWQKLPNWPGDDLSASFAAWQKSCPKLKQEPWLKLCSEAKNIPAHSAQQFIESRFSPYQLTNADGSQTGLITGYYEPVYPGSLQKTTLAPYPVYAPPKDMITVELAELYPELKGKRVRGRVIANKLVPYFNRADIVKNNIDAPVLAWLESPMDVQFLQIQGSGRVRLADGKQLRLGYADQNGHPYKPVGRWLVEQGKLKAADVSMQTIRSWADANPAQIETLLDSNPSYVFFRTLPPSNDGPVGAQNIPLTAGFSIAVDKKMIPLGSMAFIATDRPDNGGGIHRLVAAQDTGGAIHGTVRADFFWGTGDAAGELAGKMKQSGQLWLLWPNHHPLPAAN